MSFKLSNLSNELSDYWSSLKPSTKRTVALTSAVGGVVLVVLVGVKATESVAPAARPIRQPKGELLTGRSDTSKLGMDALQAQLTAQARASSELANQVKTLQQQLEQQRNKTQELAIERSNAAAELPPLPLPARSNPRLNLPPPPLVAESSPSGDQPTARGSMTSPAVASEIEVVRPDASSAPQAPVKTDYVKVGQQAPGARNVNAENQIVLPAGTILSGVLLTGLDAATANNAKSQPLPALLRIKGEALLPNRYRMDLSDCNLIAGSAGDLSSERAYLRAESISCIKSDGTVLEASINGYATGEDGKAGVRGRLVRKDGELIAKSLMAGFASGVSQIMSPARVPQLTLNPGATAAMQRPDFGVVGQEAAYAGIHNATSQIASYYMDMARNTFPVLEIDAGRKIDFVITAPARLRGTPVGGTQLNPAVVQAAAEGVGNAASQVIRAATAQPDLRQQAVGAAMNALPR